MEEYLKLLKQRLMECMALSVELEKIESVDNLFSRHISELLQMIKDSQDADLIKSKFSSFVNKILSTIEALGLSDMQYKAVRKLVLSEIYNCLDLVLVILKEEKSNMEE